MDLMHTIAMHCPEEVYTMIGCYDESETELTSCINCVSEWLQLGIKCDGLDGDYESCNEVCLPQCDQEVIGAFECGLGYLPCNPLEVYLGAE